MLIKTTLTLKNTDEATNEESRRQLGGIRAKIDGIRPYLSEDENKTVITYVKNEVSFITNLLPSNNKGSGHDKAELLKYDCIYPFGCSLEQHFNVTITALTGL